MLPDPQNQVKGSLEEEKLSPGNEDSTKDVGEATDGDLKTIPPPDAKALKSGASSPIGSGVSLKYGRYQVTKLLGEGSFGKVWQAWDPELKRTVALKVGRRSAEGRQIEKQEAQALAQLRHPGIVAVYDVGETPSGELFIVGELVDGCSLLERTRRGHLSLEAARRIIAEAAEALHHAHKRGFVHRDIKPANILLDKEEHAHVADFGLAIHDSQRWENAGELSGTLAYMAPEQVRGEAHRLDGRTDIWALGIILYELATGHRPFGGKNRRELADEIQHRSPKPLSMVNEQLPEDLEAIVRKCLEKPLNNRYSSAHLLAVDLRRVLLPPVRLTWKRFVAGLLAVSVVAALVLQGLAFGNRKPLKEQREQEDLAAMTYPGPELKEQVAEATSVPSATPSTRTPLFVLSFGVSNYPGKVRPDFANDDAQRVGDVFARQAANCYDLRHHAVILDAKKARILRELQTLQEEIAPYQGSVMTVLYFSGLSEITESRLGKNEFRFRPLDAVSGDLSTYLSAGELAPHFKSLAGRGVVLLLFDTCHAATLVDAAIQAVPAGLSQASGKPSVLLIAATTESQSAMQQLKLKASVFTHCLVQGLRGNADYDNDREVTLDELAMYVKSQVPAKTGLRQTPFTNLGSIAGRLPLTFVKPADLVEIEIAKVRDADERASAFKLKNIQVQEPPMNTPGASSLDECIAQFADKISERLKSQNQKDVILGSFTASDPLQLATGESLIRMRLIEKLRFNGIEPTKVGKYGIKGEYLVVPRTNERGMHVSISLSLTEGGKIVMTLQESVNVSDDVAKSLGY